MNFIVVPYEVCERQWMVNTGAFVNYLLYLISHIKDFSPSDLGTSVLQKETLLYCEKHLIIIRNNNSFHEKKVFIWNCYISVLHVASPFNLLKEGEKPVIDKNTREDDYLFIKPKRELLFFNDEEEEDDFNDLPFNHSSTYQFYLSLKREIRKNALFLSIVTASRDREYLEMFICGEQLTFDKPVMNLFFRFFPKSDNHNLRHMRVFKTNPYSRHTSRRYHVPHCYSSYSKNLYWRFDFSSICTLIALCKGAILFPPSERNYLKHYAPFTRFKAHKEFSYLINNLSPHNWAPSLISIPLLVIIANSFNTAPITLANQHRYPLECVLIDSLQDLFYHFKITTDNLSRLIGFYAPLEERTTLILFFKNFIFYSLSGERIFVTEKYFNYCV